MNPYFNPDDHSVNSAAFRFWLKGVALCVALLTFLLLSSCKYTERAARKDIAKVDAFWPGVLSAKCAEDFNNVRIDSSSTEVRPGAVLPSQPAALVDCDSAQRIKDSTIASLKAKGITTPSAPLKVQCPECPPQRAPDTVIKNRYVQVVNEAALDSALHRINTEIEGRNISKQENAVLEARLKDTKGERNTARIIAGVLAVACLGLGFLLFKR